MKFWVIFPIAGLLLQAPAQACQRERFRTQAQQLTLEGLEDELAEPLFAEVAPRLLERAIDAEFRKLASSDGRVKIRDFFRTLSKEQRALVIDGTLIRLVGSLSERPLADQLATAAISSRDAVDRWIRRSIEAANRAWIRLPNDLTGGVPTPGNPEALFQFFKESSPAAIRIYLARRLNEASPLVLFRARALPVGPEIARAIAERYSRLAVAHREGAPNRNELPAWDQAYLDRAEAAPLDRPSVSTVWLRLNDPTRLLAEAPRLLREIQRNPRRVELDRDLLLLDALITLQERLLNGSARTEFRRILHWVLGEPVRPELLARIRLGTAPPSVLRAWKYSGAEKQAARGTKQ